MLGLVLPMDELDNLQISIMSFVLEKVSSPGLQGPNFKLPPS